MKLYELVGLVTFDLQELQSEENPSSSKTCEAAKKKVVCDERPDRQSKSIIEN